MKNLKLLIIGLLVISGCEQMPDAVPGALAVTAEDDIVVETIARESSGEPLEAQVMCGRVIITRSAERKQTFEKVVLSPHQFSCWNTGSKQKPRTKQELETARRAWEIALTRKDNPNLYCDTSVNPYWARSKKVKFIKQIGRLKFYREEKCVTK